MPIPSIDLLEPLPADRASFLHPLDHLELIRYLERVRLTHGYVKLVGLPDMDQRNDDLPLGSLFVEPRVGPQPLNSASFDERVSAAATSPILSAIAQHQRLILLGDPGAGKTTVVNWLCAALSQSLESPVTSTLGRLVPLPFTLRDLMLGVDISWDELFKRFLERPLASSLTSARPLLDQLLASGQALILLDGIDEVGSSERRLALRDAVWDGWKRFPRCRWILTSRIVGYEEAPFDQRLVARSAKDGSRIKAFVSGVEFIEAKEQLATTLYISPFSDAQVAQFVENWFRLRETDPLIARETIHDLLVAFANDPGTKELARIPNLLTLIALIYRVRAKLPDGRAELYFQIAQAYLKTIDEFRKIDRDLPPYTFDEKLQWLAEVGWWMQLLRTDTRPREELDAPREYIATEAEVLSWLEAAMKSRYPDCSAQEAKKFLHYVRRRTGLLLERGEGRYAFLHLSFQEFFAARYLVAQINDPDWVLKNLAANPSAYRGDPASAFTLSIYCGLSLWQETLVFLFESLPLKWTERVIKSLYLESVSGIAQFEPAEKDYEETDQARWVLAARLTGDPHVALSAHFREELMALCWRWQLGGTENKWRAIESNASLIARQLLARRDTMADGWRALTRVMRTKDNFTSLSFARCTALSDLRPLTALSHVRILDLSGCTGISDLSPLAMLSNLEHLLLQGCTNLTDLSPLAELPKLQKLTITVGTGFDKLALLSELSSLQELYLEDAAALNDLSLLTRLFNLHTLSLVNFTALSDLSSLATLSNLRTLALFNCTAIGDLSSFQSLSKLRQLLLLSCTTISDLSSIKSFSNLETLLLDGCTALTDLEPINLLSNLRLISTDAEQKARFADTITSLIRRGVRVL